MKPIPSTSGPNNPLIPGLWYDIQHLPISNHAYIDYFKDLCLDVITKHWEPDTDSFVFRRVADVRIVKQNSDDDDYDYRKKKLVLVSLGGNKPGGRIVAFMIHPEWETIAAQSFGA